MQFSQSISTVTKFPQSISSVTKFPQSIEQLQNSRKTLNSLTMPAKYSTTFHFPNHNPVATQLQNITNRTIKVRI